MEEEGQGSQDFTDSGPPESSDWHSIFQEHLEKENKLLSELNEVKTKSRKVVTALRAQLADVESKHAGETSSLQGELASVREKLEWQEQKRESLEAELSALRTERDALHEELERSTFAQHSAETAAQQLHGELETLARGMEARVREGERSEVASRSAQWTEQSGGRLTPQLAGDSLHSLPPVLYPMSEVALHDFNPSTTTLPSSPLHASLQHTPRSLLLPGSLSGSATSVEAPPGTPPHPHILPPQQHNLTMLSALSHLLPPTNNGTQLSALSFDHPVLVEWGKAYECVLQLRDRLVGMLLDLPGLEGLARELEEVEVHRVDQASGDVSSEVMQMR